MTMRGFSERFDILSIVRCQASTLSRASIGQLPEQHTDNCCLTKATLQLVSSRSTKHAPALNLMHI